MLQGSTVTYGVVKAIIDDYRNGKLKQGEVITLDMIVSDYNCGRVTASKSLPFLNHNGYILKKNNRPSIFVDNEPIIVDMNSIDSVDSMFSEPHLCRKTVAKYKDKTIERSLMINDGVLTYQIVAFSEDYGIELRPIKPITAMLDDIGIKAVRFQRKLSFVQAENMKDNPFENLFNSLLVKVEDRVFDYKNKELYRVETYSRVGILEFSVDD